MNNQLGVESISASAQINFNRIFGNDADIITNTKTNAQNNWWGSNMPPEIENVDIKNWLYMTFTTDPTIILNGGTSQLTADFNNSYDGETITPLDPAGGHIPDGTMVCFTTDLGSVGSKNVDIATINGVASVLLTADEGTGTAHITAQLDKQILESKVDITNTLYVNADTGDDAWSGTSPAYTGGTTGPVKTIQNAINKINSGGTIQVAKGTYHETLNINKDLSLIGENQDTTIIDANNLNQVIKIDSGTVTLNSFTLQNGALIGVNVRGGGIFNQGNLTIENCTIQNNNATSTTNGFEDSLACGGGIYNQGNLIIINSLIRNNTAQTSTDYSANTYGGGIYNSLGSVEINNSNIIENVANTNEGDSHAGGGGIYNHKGLIVFNNSYMTLNTSTGRYVSGAGINNDQGTVEINNSNIYENSCNGRYVLGGGIYNYGEFTIQNSNINDNVATGWISVSGGGIHTNGNMEITNSNIFGNQANGDYASGGGINSSGILNITNSTIENNNAKYGGGINNNGTLPTVSYKKTMPLETLHMVEGYI